MTRAGTIRMAAAAALFGAALTGGLAAQTPPPQGSRARAIPDEGSAEDTKKQLIGLDWGVMKAAQQKDRATLETLLAPDFTVTRLVDGRALIVGSRDAFLELNQTIRGYLFVETEARLHGPVATVTSRLSLMSNRSDGSDRSGEFLLVDLWTRSGSTWKLAARFTSPAEKSPE